MAKTNEPYVKVQEIIMQTPTVSSAASTSNIGGVIVSPVGPRLAYVTSPVEFLKLYCADGETIPRDADTTFINAYYLSYYSGLVISRSINTNALGGLLVYKGTDDTESANPVIKAQKFIQKDGSIMTDKDTIEIKVPYSDDLKTESLWAFAMNGVVYYSILALDPVSGLPQVIYDEFEGCTEFKECETIEDVVAMLENTDNVHVTNSDNTGRDTITIDGTETTVKVLTIDVVHTKDESFTIGDQYHCEAAVQNVVADGDELPEDGWLFTIIGDIPLKGDTNNIKISQYKEDGVPVKDLFTISIDDLDYLVSLNKSKTVDDVNMYIEYLNTQNIGYTVEVFGYEDINFGDETHGSYIPENGLTASFGASGFDEEQSKSNSNIFEALDYLAEQEIYDIEYLAPFGLTDASIANRYQIVSNANKWFCPIDVPKNCTTYTAVKRFSETLLGKYENMPTGLMLGPFDRKTNVTGWYTDIAASTLYFERVMLNKQNSAEFAPVFRQDYGTMSYSDPVKLFKKTERTDLLSLDKPVNWAVYDQKSTVYYMNDNRTFQPDQDSVVCEEQNARLVWKVSKDVARIVDKFIGKYNTRSTRAQVVDAITYYLEWNIMNKKFPPEAYIIQCDEYNNPDSLINENKLAVELKIRLYKAIKYVEVINRVFPLGVDFSTSI